MALFTSNHIRIAGISACVPKQIVSNEDYEWVSEDDRRTLIKIIGVREKRIAPAKLATSDMCFYAAEKLLQQLGWHKNEIELLIFVSQSGDYLLPATAVILQDRLGLSKNCMALDIGLGCSGYVYGMSVAAGMMSSGKIRKGLLLAGDKSSLRMSPKDKSTYPLFGDAGSATALELTEQSLEMLFNLQSDGSGYQNIIIRDGVGRNPMKESSLEYQKIDKGIERRPLDLELNGAGVFDFALREVMPNIRQTLAFSKTEIESIDYFVLHQANFLMNETLRKMMKIPSEKVPYSIQKFGNTSSASIPLTIVSQLQSVVTEEALKLLLCGFGVGLSWGTVIVQTDKIVCPDLIEYNE